MRPPPAYTLSPYTTLFRSETYIHCAENNTDVQRIILFCDVQRPLSNRVARLINATLGRQFIKAGATQNVAGEHVSLVNRDRKSTRLNSSHLGISYAVFCLK